MALVHPERLWLGVLVLPLAWCWWRSRKQRARAWVALAQQGRPPRGGMGAWLGAMVLLIVALAQPRWGTVPGTELPPGHDVVLLIDVSRSMGATDAVPNRLAAAIEAAQSLVDAVGRGPGERAAVVAFAGRGVLRFPLTENFGAVVDILHALRPGEVQPGGTDLGAGLVAALDAFDGPPRAEGRAIVVFSDGEDHPGSWSSPVAALRAAGVVVHAVGLGDAEEGSLVPSSQGKPLMYQGSPVVSRRTDTALSAVARETGGAFVPLGVGMVDLGRLYRERIAPVAARKSGARRGPERIERFGLFVLAAMVVVLAGPWPRSSPSRAWSAILVLGLGASPPPEGIEAYAAGSFRRALDAFERDVRRAPDEPVPRYNAAATLYRLGRYVEARQHYREARARGDARLRTKIDFALGNTALALGEVHSAVRHYDACLASTVPGEELVAVRRDAAINRAFAVRHLDSPPPPGMGPAEEPEREPSPASETSNKAVGPAESPPVRPDPDPTTAAPAAGSPEANPPSASPRNGARSPEQRLADALRQARERRRQRLEEPPTSGEAQDRKDW